MLKAIVFSCLGLILSMTLLFWLYSIDKISLITLALLSTGVIVSITSIHIFSIVSKKMAAGETSTSAE